MEHDDSNTHDDQPRNESTTPPPAGDPPAPPKISAKTARFRSTDIGNGRAALLPATFDEVWRLATLFSKSGEFVPQVYRENPAMCATAIAWGMELGLSPLNAIASIAPIKGRAALWGDGLKAVAMTHPDYVDCIEEPIGGSSESDVGWRCTAKRRGRADVIRKFTMGDAARAGLLGRDTPWKGYGANRMAMFRARNWALRDQFPDALRGIYSGEEAIELPDDALRRAPAETIHEPLAIEHRENPLDVPISDAMFSEPETEPVHTRVESADPDDPARVAPEPSEQFSPKPISSGQAMMLDSYLRRAEGHGITRQDVIDELGDDVHAHNLQHALDWLGDKIAAAEATRGS